MAVVIVMQVQETAQTTRLVQAGVRTEAKVVSIFQGVCTRRMGCEAAAHYVFQPNTGPFAGRAFDGAGVLATGHWDDDPDYRYARATGRAPIVYDPARPTTSELNFRDAVFHRDMLGGTIEMLAVIGGATVFLMGFAVLAWIQTKAGSRTRGAVAT